MKDVLVSGEVLLTEDCLGVGAVVFDAHGGRLQSHLVIGDLVARSRCRCAGVKTPTRAYIHASNVPQMLDALTGLA